MFEFQNPVHVLRTCTAQMTGTQTQSQHFVWPREGPVSCNDWDPTPKCGHGLHGALRGEGDGRMFNWEDDAVWMVVEVESSEVVDLGGKVKFPRGNVILAGSRDEAIALMQELYPHSVVIGGTATAGDDGTATAGYRGTATAGDYGTATAGYRGTATAGYRGTATAGDDGTATAGDDGTATAGDYGTATAGYRGTATAGDYGTATAGYYGTATAGYRGTATAGDYGTATAGDDGTATAGDYGTATAGDYGTATAGDDGTIVIKYWNGKRYKFKIGYIGEDNLEPNKPYRLNEEFEFVDCGRGDGDV